MGSLDPRPLIICLIALQTHAQEGHGFAFYFSEQTMGKHVNIGYSYDEDKFGICLGIGYLLPYNSQEKRSISYILNWEGNTFSQKLSPFVKSTYSIWIPNEHMKLSLGMNISAGKRINRETYWNEPTRTLFSDELFIIEGTALIDLNLRLFDRIWLVTSGGLNLLRVFEDVPEIRIDQYGNKYYIGRAGSGFVGGTYFSVGLKYRLNE